MLFKEFTLIIKKNLWASSSMVRAAVSLTASCGFDSYLAYHILGCSSTVEHLAVNQGVESSILSSPAILETQ